MFELSWLFWILVVFLFAESWARVWVAWQRNSEPPARSLQAPDT